jgi:hypothetical protein
MSKPLPLLYQFSAISNAAHELEIDVSDIKQIDWQFCFLLSMHEAAKVSARCIKVYNYAPIICLMDDRLPVAGKGMVWLTTDNINPAPNA